MVYCLGWIGGAAGILVGSPLDVLKVWPFFDNDKKKTGQLYVRVSVSINNGYYRHVYRHQKWSV